MPEITVHEESQTDRGWSFRLTWAGAHAGRAIGVGHADEDRQSAERTVTLNLGWHDYEHWSHGMAAPMDVARSVLEAALEERPELALPPKIDASTLRRMVEGFDALVRKRLGG